MRWGHVQVIMTVHFTKEISHFHHFSCTPKPLHIVPTITKYMGDE